LTVGFLTAGYGVWRGTRWAVGLTGVLAVVSLVVCLLGLPETFAGIAINVVTLAMVAYVVFVRDRAASQLG
jgi:peptidoglycan/LPS O-acetylase OafA/YrhL